MEIREPTGDDWLIIPKWERFQHYRDRHPTWIKVYARLLHDPAYLSLSLASRGLLQVIWLAYSQENGQLSVRNLAKILGTSVSKISLISLNDAGFVAFSASKPLALSTEKEKEKEVELPVDNSETRPPAVRHRYNDPTLLAQAYNLILDWTGGPSEDLDAQLDNLEQELHSRLRQSERANLWEVWQHLQSQRQQ